MHETEELDIDSLDYNINIHFKENSPNLDGIISEVYQRPDKYNFQESPE